VQLDRIPFIRSSSRESVIRPLPRNLWATLRDIAASVFAVVVYVVVAFCTGLLASILLAPFGYDWPRFAVEAAVTTCLGMIVSWRLTNALFPNRSGKWLFAAFAGVVVIAVLAGRTGSPNWLHLGQATLLVVLAYGLFWPHVRSAR
jgi:hypothetical protein